MANSEGVRHDHTLKFRQVKPSTSSISISMCLICIIDYAMDYGDYHGLWMIMVLMLIVSVDFGQKCRITDLPPVCLAHRTSPYRGNHREVWPPIRCRGATVRFRRGFCE